MKPLFSFIISTGAEMVFRKSVFVTKSLTTIIAFEG